MARAKKGHLRLVQTAPPQTVSTPMPCPLCGGEWHDLRAHMAKYKPERCEHCEAPDKGDMWLDFDLVLHPHPALQGRYSQSS